MTTVWTILGVMLAMSGSMLWLAWVLRKGAKAEAENEQQKDVIDAIRTRNQVERDVDALGADAARKELRKWTRD